MKYNVSYKCGHTVTVNILGKESERANKIAYFEQNECPDCFKARKAAEREKINAQWNAIDMKKVMAYTAAKTGLNKYEFIKEYGTIVAIVLKGEGRKDYMFNYEQFLKTVELVNKQEK